MRIACLLIMEGWHDGKTANIGNSRRQVSENQLLFFQ
jgi:hypothetical protein